VPIPYPWHSRKTINIDYFLSLFGSSQQRTALSSTKTTNICCFVGQKGQKGGEASRLLGCRSLRSQRNRTVRQKTTNICCFGRTKGTEEFDKNNQYPLVWSDKRDRRVRPISVGLV
jgi:hypothetical protein